MSASDLTALWLTFRLAAVSTGLLLAFGIPLAWWLVRARTPMAAVINAVVALPLVLPPTVIGFYLLLAMGPEGFAGQLTSALGIGPLPFSFAGLVIGSVIYSLPFVVQPLQAAFAGVPDRLLDAAATLGASPWDRFLSVGLPLAVPGIVAASVLGFAHTVGEFGVVLMIGGSIPGETRVVSVQVFDHVEALDYGSAHALSLVLVAFSLVVLTIVYSIQGRGWRAGLSHPVKTP